MVYSSSVPNPINHPAIQFSAAKLGARRRRKEGKFLSSIQSLAFVCDKLFAQLAVPMFLAILRKIVVGEICEDKPTFYDADDT